MFAVTLVVQEEIRAVVERTDDEPSGNLNPPSSISEYNDIAYYGLGGSFSSSTGYQGEKIYEPIRSCVTYSPELRDYVYSSPFFLEEGINKE